MNTFLKMLIFEEIFVKHIFLNLANRDCCYLWVAKNRFLVSCLSRANNLFIKRAFGALSYFVDSHIDSLTDFQDPF